MQQQYGLGDREHQADDLTPRAAVHDQVEQQRDLDDGKRNAQVVRPTLVVCDPEACGSGSDQSGQRQDPSDTASQTQNSAEIAEYRILEEKTEDSRRVKQEHSDLECLWL